MYIITSQFLYCCTFYQIIIVNNSTNAPITKNNSCTLCVPMFYNLAYETKMFLFFIPYLQISQLCQVRERVFMFEIKLVVYHVAVMTKKKTTQTHQWMTVKIVRSFPIFWDILTNFWSQLSKRAKGCWVLRLQIHLLIIDISASLLKLYYLV